MPSSVDINQTQFNVNVVKSEAVFEEMKKQGLPPRQIFMTPDTIGNVDNLRTKVLWTNPNPSADFPSQTITLNSGDYDYLMVITIGNKAYSFLTPSTLIVKGKGGRLINADASESTSYKIMINVRDMTRVSDTQYTISACRYSHDTTYESGRNDLIIPYQIIGLYKNPAALYTGFGLDELLDRFYPVGSIYTSTENISPASTLGGTWEQLPAGYALWTASSGAGNTISAGLPNITGYFGSTDHAGNSYLSFNTNYTSGAFSNAYTGASMKYSVDQSTGSSGGWTDRLYFNANNGATTKSIYGNSTTVQPPAYKVYAWKRIS